MSPATVAPRTGDRPDPNERPSDRTEPSPRRPLWSRVLRHRATRWVGAVLLVGLIIAATINAFASTASGNGPNDPRSSQAAGAGAAGAVLRQEGVDVRPTRAVGDAVRDGTGATVVVAFPDRLTPGQARRLLEIADARIILLAPRESLADFGIDAESAYAASATLAPECADPAAERAGTIRLPHGYLYRPGGAPTTACYPREDGYGYLRVPAGAGREVEVLGGGWTNDEIAEEGNAALVLGLFGARERLVWLLETSPDDQPVGGGDEPRPPTILPGWWPMAVAQAVVAVIIVGVWRGRRLGPIILERLPVRVRASETVEGHGRLYFRLSARDRAAAALRDGVVHRLSRRYGHGNDPMALSAALAERTGRDSRQVYKVLFGAAPADDDQLLDLAENLDQLEQEARQP